MIAFPYASVACFCKCHARLGSADHHSKLSGLHGVPHSISLRGSPGEANVSNPMPCTFSVKCSHSIPYCTYMHTALPHSVQLLLYTQLEILIDPVLFVVPDAIHENGRLEPLRTDNLFAAIQGVQVDVLADPGIRRHRQGRQVDHYDAGVRDPPLRRDALAHLLHQLMLIILLTQILVNSPQLPRNSRRDVLDDGLDLPAAARGSAGMSCPNRQDHGRHRGRGEGRGQRSCLCAPRAPG